jgi:hypothetical protein
MPNPKHTEKRTMRYVGRGIPRSIPAGRVLVHNHIMHSVDTPCGVNGFRAWTDAPDSARLLPCDCGWSGLPHFRVRLREGEPPQPPHP